MRAALAFLLGLLVASCSPSRDDGVLDIAVIGEGEELFDNTLRLGFAGQHVRAATTQGLVAVNEAGQVVPAIAERWIVTDDGASYIFRIREFDLPDGSRLTAQTVRDSLRSTWARLGGTSLGLDLAQMRDIRAMTGRVVEIRLKSPMPGFLQLLAQPEMGIALRGARTGPMGLRRSEGMAVLDALLPEQRGFPMQPGFEDGLVQLQLTATDAQDATSGFGDGRFDLVLGGKLASLPLADTGGLSRGTVRLDSAVGLFGLDVAASDGFLAVSANREALSMALDRANLLQRFNIAGWIPTTRIVAPGLPGDRGQVEERWAEMTLDERQARSRGRVSSYAARTGGDVSLSVALAQGPGSDLLFDELAGQLAGIGVTLTRAKAGTQADLVERDRLARYGGARWFLNQFHCDISPKVCSEDVDFLVDLAVDARDQAESMSYLEEAERTLASTNLFIPFGAPIRWSLVRGDVDGFAENPWGIHPLFPLSRAPI